MKVCIDKKEIMDNPNDSSLGELVRKKMNEILEGSSEFDVCVICGKKSPYTMNTNIELRIGYVEGAGQGCFSPEDCSVF